MTLIRSSCLLLFAILLFNTSDVYAWGEESCASVKKRLTTEHQTGTGKRDILRDVDNLIRQNEPCAKNILGRIYYDGIYLPQDKEKARAIFYDLAQQRYPPATFNLAYFAIKERQETPMAIIGLLHGLMLQYLGDREWGYISASSRDLVWGYLDELSAVKFDPTELDILRDQHRILAANSTHQLAEAVKARTADLRTQSDAIMGLITLGLAANAISRSGGISRPFPLPTTTGFSPRLYTVVPTGSPNVLYLIPH